VTLTLEQAIARVPGWDHADLRASALGGGITNHNFRIDVGGQAFVLRLVGDRTDLLGIDRETEYAANRAAAAAGVAPEVVFFVRPEGCLVTRFIEGSPISEDDVGRPEVIRKVAGALRTIHGLPPIPGRFSAFEVVETYAAIAREHGVSFPAAFGELHGHLADIQRALPEFAPCPCHNDLLNANFLEAAGRIYVLDWEYAGMGDPFFDLANFSRNHNFDEDQNRVLLEAYAGEATPGRTARLHLMRVASDMREAMWGLLQSGISSLDFDFPAYADKHFRRAAEGIGDPRWSRWLKEAVHGV
jgi:thiamine kinase-like enzyme